MIIERIANRGYNIYDDFPHFVPREEREYNLGYAHDISLPTHAQEVLTARFPDIFHDYYDDFEAAGFTQIDTTSTGSWSNENDDSRLADLCRELGVVLEFTSCRIICTK